MKAPVETKAKPKRTVKSKTSAVPKLPPVKQALQNHLIYSSFKTSEAATPRDWYEASAYSVRDYVVERWGSHAGGDRFAAGAAGLTYPALRLICDFIRGCLQHE